MEIFRTDKYEEVSLADWLAHTPSAMVQQTLNLSPETIAKFSRDGRRTSFRPNANARKRPCGMPQGLFYIAKKAAAF